MKRILILICIGFLLKPLCIEATTLFDIDFESPHHTVNQTVSVDGSIYTPSSISFGDPRVVNYGLDQSLEFNTICALEQPWFLLVALYQQASRLRGQDLPEYHPFQI